MEALLNKKIHKLFLPNTDFSAEHQSLNPFHKEVSLKPIFIIFPPAFITVQTK